MQGLGFENLLNMSTPQRVQGLGFLKPETLNRLINPEAPSPKMG